MIWIVCPSTSTVVTGMPEPQAQALVLTAAAVAAPSRIAPSVRLQRTAIR